MLDLASIVIATACLLVPARLHLPLRPDLMPSLADPGMRAPLPELALIAMAALLVLVPSVLRRLLAGV